MTRISILSSAAIALAVTLGAGCERASETTKEGTATTTGAQVEAEKKIAAAEGEFAKRREDYRHKIQSDLTDLDKKIDRLEAKAKASTGTAKADLDMKLAEIRTRRAAFGKSFAGVEKATASQWDDLKGRVDKEWDDLKAMVDKAD